MVLQPFYGGRGTNWVMSWQDRLRELGERLVAGEITTAQYRTESEGILAEADREAAADTQPAPSAPSELSGASGASGVSGRGKVHIPVSAAWEAPSGEMTQIVGRDDRTTAVSVDSIAERLERDGGDSSVTSG